MKNSYQTRQRKLLLECFINDSIRSFTVEELVEAAGEEAPAVSTAYRIVKKLCDEGLVRRLTREGTRQAVYQIAGQNCCTEHLHIRCVDCGMLIHLDSRAQQVLTESTGFVLDDERSMLYGHCAKCMEARLK